VQHEQIESTTTWLYFISNQKKCLLEVGQNIIELLVISLHSHEGSATIQEVLEAVGSNIIVEVI
jgi:hypothetical protein